MTFKSDFRPDLLEGKVVVITGGGSGIGLGIARACGLHGAKVVIGGRREAKLQEACEALRKDGVKNIEGFPCDVRDPKRCEDFIKKAVEAFGTVDVLVNNAAGNFSTTIEKLSPNGFNTIMQIDLMGCFNMSKAALPYLKTSGKGLIVNISATLHYKAFPFQMAASSAKSAIDVLTKNIGVEWGTDYGIRAVSVAPGPIENTVGGPGGRVFGKMLGADGGPDLREFVPIGRFGTVDDIGNTILFLASDAGSYINATTIVVDGGQYHEASGRYLLAKRKIAEASDKERQTHKGGVERAKM
ncbi:Peroxisomal 2,4-dienoyl-CoA reductase [Hondaea fermentalgiana]|uniref:2,4-dienoyl-CoA reductase [(3E)-enoyl-CoA-producing] n=1 Tax=Hondaea fermentalgiana TaxID=2315210 RepID=A0A2R5GJ64_9STRA|nr:Peroxisomal 2,4-dienoyl-CoA reductase [Hondaea fermentalgiana]|eukprot:GBG28331.1 Peroxisomal 2,4-dienoyl-CoA reductase [Hondaea fermentalgiana]